MDYIFKTTLNCGNCVNMVKGTLNANPDINGWQVDTLDPNKLLKISTSLSPEKVAEILSDLGFEASLWQENA